MAAPSNCAEERRTSSGLDRNPVESARALALRRELEQEGYEYSAFAHYLASRPDWFTPRECRALDGYTAPEPMKAWVIDELLVRQLGAALSRAFQEFRLVPVRSVPQYQLHRAVLPTGEPVMVKINRPAFQEWLSSCEMPLKSLVRRARCAQKWPGVPWNALIADFRMGTLERLDRYAEANALRSVAVDRDEFETAVSPAVVWALSSPAILTRHASLSFLLAASPLEVTETVRRLWFAWLHQVVLGRTAPMDAAEDEFGVNEEGQIEFAGGEFVSFPTGTRDAVLGYLGELAAGDAGSAYAYLAREMELPRGGDGLAQGFAAILLRSEFQLDGTGLADCVLTQWRFLATRGALASRHLLRFQQGFFRIAEICRAMSPASDGLRAALERVHLRSSLTRLRTSAEPERLMDAIEEYTMILNGVPGNVDTVLRADYDAITGHCGARRASMHAYRIRGTLILLLCSALLWCDYLAPAHGWAQPAGFTGVLIFTVAVLLAGRRR